MGTRHLICIYHNGRFLVAQYGHWDGYPDGAGLAVLRFLTPANIKLLRKRIHIVRPPRPCDEGDFDSRGTAILREIASAEGTVEHVCMLDFARDSLMCEWAYIVDLDAGALEVYRGGSDLRNSRAQAPCCSDGFAGPGRFARVGVLQQELQGIFSFEDLPADEDAFVLACGGIKNEKGYFDWSL
jgi:hypothetical protein